MWLTLEMRAQRPCTRCRIAIPLTGLRERVTCHGCGAHVGIEQELAAAQDGGARYWFGAYYDAVADALLVGDDRRLLAETDDEAHMKLRRSALVCSCTAPLQHPQPRARQLTCSKCHATTPVRWADDGTARWDPRLLCVVGDAGDADVATGSGEHPLFLVYQLDEQAQLDAWQWLRAHPSRAAFDEEDDDDDDADQPDPFGQLVARRIAELGEAALAIRCKRALEARGPVELATLRELVTWPKLGELDVMKLDVRLTDELRAGVVDLEIAAPLALHWSRSSSSLTRLSAARVQGLDPAVQATLAADSESSVRAAIAARADAPAQVIAGLRKDRDASVAAAAKANPAHKAGLLSRLFGG